MINNSYFIIYNKSFDIIHESLKFYINEEKEVFKKNYELKNSKKITGYMLFVRDYYKKDSNNKKKEISIKWKKLDKKERNEYDNRANILLKSYNKMINKKEEKTVIKVVEKIKDKEEEEIIECTYKIKEIVFDNKKYYVDDFENIIDIEKNNYLGHIDRINNKIYFL